MKHANTCRGARPHAQSGYSLIELSVALVVALFLLAGFFSILQSTRKTSNSQSQLAQLQDNERIAMTMITGVVEAGGYYPNPDFNTIDAELPASGVFTQTGQVVYGAANGTVDLATGTADFGDKLTVRYNADAKEDVIDCKGTTNADKTSAVSYVNQFLIMQDSATTPPYLACTTDGTHFAKLVNNVSKMEISYGVSTAATVANTTGVPVDTYFSTADMTTNAKTNPILWTNVFSVKVKLTLINPLASQPGQPTVPGQAATIPFTKVIGIMSRVGVDVVNFK
jgi:type IV pilus assembly protein PilW